MAKSGEGESGVFSPQAHEIYAWRDRGRARILDVVPTRSPAESVSERIFLLRGRRVLLDSTLAEVYGVTTRRLNEQVRRNRARFPEDFLLELTRDELNSLKSHFATSRWGGRRKLPLAFTEHGAIMVATILSSPRAVEMAVYVVRAFVRFRETLVSNERLERRLQDLEHSLIALNLTTHRKFREVYEAIRALRAEPTPKKRPIGFTGDLQ